MNPAELIIYLVVMLVVFVPFLVVFARSYKRCPSNRMIVRTGVAGLQTRRHEGMVVLPLLHSYGLLSLEPCQVRLTDGAVAGIPDLSSWQFTIAVGTTDELIEIAASRLLNKEAHEISQFAKDSITGVLSRSTEPPSSSMALGEAVERALRAGLGEFGLELLSYGPAAPQQEPDDSESR